MTRAAARPHLQRRTQQVVDEFPAFSVHGKFHCSCTKWKLAYWDYSSRPRRKAPRFGAQIAPSKRDAQRLGRPVHTDTPAFLPQLGSNEAPLVVSCVTTSGAFGCFCAGNRRQMSRRWHGKDVPV
jgi:hypothetical protein